MKSVTRLRAVEETDLPLLRFWRSDTRVSRTALGRRFPITSVGEQEWFASLGVGDFPTTVVWSVISETEALIGLARLTDIDWINRTCWFGVWLNPESWGHGHGLRSTRLAVSYAFRELEMRQVRLHVLRDHEVARKMYRQIGFIEEGMMFRAILIETKEHDLIQMVLESGTYVPLKDLEEDSEK